MNKAFYTYLAIIGFSIALAVNPLTYGLIEPAEWWTKRIWRLYLFALDVYLVLLAIASILYVTSRVLSPP